MQVLERIRYARVKLEFVAATDLVGMLLLLQLLLLLQQLGTDNTLPANEMPYAVAHVPIHFDPVC